MRYKGIPSAIQELLDAGEHPHVDYKQVVPSDFEKSVAAAVNTVAMRSDVSEFVFLVGVRERKGPGGIRSGEVVGLLDPESGNVRDMEIEKQKVIQRAQKVTPPPDVEIDEYNMAPGGLPFFAVRVVPTDAPHRLEDRYLMRKGSHTVPLDQANLLRMFVAARNRAFIEELDHDNPLSRAIAGVLSGLVSLQTQVATLSFDLEDEREQRRDGEYERQGQQLAGLCQQLAEMQEVLDELSGLPDQLDREGTSIVQQVDGLWPITAEAVLLAVLEHRGASWIRFNHDQNFGKLPEAVSRLGRLMFEAWLFDEPLLGDYAVNRAEMAGWNQLYPGGTHGESSEDWVRLLDRAARAAIHRATRGRRSEEWMVAEADEVRYDDRTLLASVKHGFDLLPERPTGGVELALMEAPAELLRRTLRSSPSHQFSLSGGLEVLRLSDCRVEILVADSGVAAIFAHPEPPVADRTEPDEFFRQVRRRLRPNGLTVVRLSPQSGGRLRTLAGQRGKAESTARRRSGRSARKPS